MANNNSRGSSDSFGCLVLIIGILFVIGIIMVFHIDPSLIAITVIAGFFTIYFSFFAIIIVRDIIQAKKNKISKSKTSSVSSNQPTLQNPIMRNASVIPLNNISAENEANKKVNQLIAQFHVPNAPSFTTAIDSLQKEMESFQCIEVLRKFNKTISQRRDCANKMNSIKDEIDFILSCPGCSTDGERLQYIKCNEEILQKKKNDYDTISSKMKKTQVVLLSKERTAFIKLSDALVEINTSVKSTSRSRVVLSSFMELLSNIPGDIFTSEQAPIKLNFGSYKFFLLPDVILVYDKDNSFVTALEPSALNITITDKRKSVHMQRNVGSKWPMITDSIIAEDSVLVSKGYSQTYWLHEKKDGGPDLRYSHNPQFEYRTDIYAYSDFCIQIGSNKAIYSLSKANLSNNLTPMLIDYCSIKHELNAVPSLLRLLESVSKNREATSLLSEKYESISANIICKVI